ncbi:hypothetical protein HMPREF1576_01161, partial [Gardnerella pickettii JCP7719]
NDVIHKLIHNKGRIAVKFVDKQHLNRKNTHFKVFEEFSQVFLRKDFSRVSRRLRGLSAKARHAVNQVQSHYSFACLCSAFVSKNAEIQYKRTTKNEQNIEQKST